MLCICCPAPPPGSLPAGGCGLHAASPLTPTVRGHQRGVCCGLGARAAATSGSASANAARLAPLTGRGRGHGVAGCRTSLRMAFGHGGRCRSRRSGGGGWAGGYAPRHLHLQSCICRRCRALHDARRHGWLGCWVHGGAEGGRGTPSWRRTTAGARPHRTCLQRAAAGHGMGSLLLRRLGMRRTGERGPCHRHVTGQHASLGCVAVRDELGHCVAPGWGAGGTGRHATPALAPASMAQGCRGARAATLPGRAGGVTRDAWRGR